MPRSIDISSIADEIVPGVWQGGLASVANQTISIQGIDAAAFMAPDTGVTIASPAKVFKLGLLDAPEDLDKIDDVRQLAFHLATMRKVGTRLGIFCAQGWNRSGLVTAFVLRYLYQYTGAEAVRQIQSRRPDALVNQAFVSYLRALGRPQPPKMYSVAQMPSYLGLSG